MRLLHLPIRLPSPYMASVFLSMFLMTALFLSPSLVCPGDAQERRSCGFQQTVINSHSTQPLVVFSGCRVPGPPPGRPKALNTVWGSLQILELNHYQGLSLHRSQGGCRFPSKPPGWTPVCQGTEPMDGTLCLSWRDGVPRADGTGGWSILSDLSPTSCLVSFLVPR